MTTIKVNSYINYDIKKFILIWMGCGYILKTKSGKYIGTLIQILNIDPVSSDSFIYIYIYIYIYICKPFLRKKNPKFYFTSFMRAP